MRRSATGWPMWAKAVVLLIAAGGFAYVRIRGVAADAMQSLNLIGWASFDGTFVDWNGDIGARNVRIWPWEGDPETDAVTVQRLVIDTPGWGWVLKSAFSFGAPSGLLKSRAARWAARAAEQASEDSPLEDIPAMPRIHARFEGVVFSDYAHQYVWEDHVHGLASGSVFESEGCDQDLYWTEEELGAQLDVPTRGVDLELDLNASGAESIAMSLALTAPGRSSWRYESEWQAAHDGNLVLVDWQEAKLRSERWTVRDEGFVAARNAYCAKREQLTEAQFIDRHIDYVQRRLLHWGLFADPTLVNAYRSFASGGGSLTYEARPADAVSLTKLASYSGSDMLWMLNANLRLDEEKALPLKLHFVSEVPYPDGEEIENAAQIREIVAAAQAALPAEAQAVAVAEEPLQTPSPAVPTMVVSAESTMIGVDGQVPTAERPVIEEVSYDDLALMVGERVIIRTTMSSTREGELKSFNRAGLRIALRNRPGMELEVPKDTVASVQVVWTKAQTAAASAAAGNK